MSESELLHQADEYYRLKLYEEALAAYEQILQDWPSATAFFGKGNTLQRLERDSEALVAYEQAILLDPVNALFYKEKGRAHSWLGYHEEALAAYKQALELHPGDPETYAYIADSLEGLDQWDKAKQARKAHDDLQRIINNNSPFF